MRHWTDLKREAKNGFMVFVFLLGAPVLGKMSLGVQFPDIVMEKLELGGVYNLRQLKGIPYIVLNRSDKALDIQVEALVPQTADLKEGYEPLPDPNWFKILPNKFRMEAGDVTPVDIILAVPKDESLVGRHFQAHLQSRSLGAEILQVGVMHTIRFSVGAMGPDALKKETQDQAEALMSLNVDLSPQTLQAVDLPLGRPVDLHKEKGLAFKLSNLGDRAFGFKIASVPVPANMRGGLAHEPSPDPSWLKVTTPVLKVKPNRIENVKMVLNVPDAPENRGRKLLFVVMVQLDRSDMPFQMVGKVLATMKQ